MKLTYFSACVFLVLCSCGKKDSTRTVNPPAPPVIQKTEVNSVSDFKGKSNEEILAMKYDKITLKCDLWTQFAKELDLKISPNDSFEVDFLNDTSLKKSLMTLKGIAVGRIVNVDIKLSSYKLYESLNHTNLQGKQTIAQFTPALKLSNTFSASAAFGALKGTSDGDEVFENNETDLFKYSIANENEEIKYIDYLKCSLNTSIKDKYKDQFSSVEKN